MGALFRLLGFSLFIVVASLPAASTERKDDFDSEAASRAIWNFCQADPMKLEFEHASETPDSFLRNRINPSSTDHSCGDPAAAMERLGPSLIDPLAVGRAVDTNGGGIQRNELRFKDRNDWHKDDESHWYSINFKVVGAEGNELPTVGSKRWVNAQWKYEKLGPNDSPFLAQRFDNGVLHVTVEDGFCRCMIAKGPGDPNKLAGKRNATLMPVAPLECLNNKMDEPADPCEPQNLKLTAYAQDDLSSLPDPSKQWVRMTYLVKAGGARESVFEIYAKGRFIVRAEHAYQEKVESPNRIKFKFGHYRDKVRTSADILVDQICVSRDVSNCDKSVAIPK